MRTTILFAVFLMSSFLSHSKETYTISKEDFKSQFNDSSTLLRLYCYKENGDKVWLTILDRSVLTIRLHNKRKKQITLSTVKYRNDSIVGFHIDALFDFIKNPVRVSFNDVSSITINRNYELETPFFNIDSCRIIVNAKNDSLANIYSTAKQFVIYLEPKEKTKTNTIVILENACYNFIFKDNTKVKYGVVHEITQDSIFLYNSFNASKAKKDEIEYTLLKYPIKHILKISVLKSGGYSFVDYETKNYNFIIEEEEKLIESRPYWFKLSYTGEINFYRTWLTER